jgi:hypothetical protein
VSREGGTSLVGVVETEGEGAPDIEIVSLAWDASRNRLWAVSPQFGLTIAEPPKSAKVKKVVYS